MAWACRLWATRPVGDQRTGRVATPALRRWAGLGLVLPVVPRTMLRVARNVRQQFRRTWCRRFRRRGADRPCSDALRRTPSQRRRLPRRRRSPAESHVQCRIQERRFVRRIDGSRSLLSASPSSRVAPAIAGRAAHRLPRFRRASPPHRPPTGRQRRLIQLAHRRSHRGNRSVNELRQSSDTAPTSA